MSSCVLLVCLSFAGAGDDIVALKELGVTLPRTIANIQYMKRQAFPQKGLGYSVAYANKMCTISLIVYDLDKKGIPNGKANALVEGQVKQSLDDLQTAQERGFYTKLQSMKGELPLPAAVKATFATAGVTFDVPGGGCKSYVLLVGRNQHFLKVRVTQYIVNGQTNDAEINAFLTTLVKELNKPASP